MNDTQRQLATPAPRPEVYTPEQKAWIETHVFTARQLMERFS